MVARMSKTLGHPLLGQERPTQLVANRCGDEWLELLLLGALIAAITWDRVQGN